MHQCRRFVFTRAPLRRVASSQLGGSCGMPATCAMLRCVFNVYQLTLIVRCDPCRQSNGFVQIFVYCNSVTYARINFVAKTGARRCALKRSHSGWKPGGIRAFSAVQPSWQVAGSRTGAGRPGSNQTRKAHRIRFICNVLNFLLRFKRSCARMPFLLLIDRQHREATLSTLENR